MAVRRSAVVGIIISGVVAAPDCVETTFEPVLQFQLQTVNAVQVSSQIEINVSGLLVPCHVVRDSIHPAFRVRLQLILERVQNP